MTLPKPLLPMTFALALAVGCAHTAEVPAAKVDTGLGALSAMTGLLDTVEFVPERMQAAADAANSAATDLAELLVQQGVPFREAHQAVGALVRQGGARGN